MSNWSRDAAVRFAAQQKIKLVQDAKVIRDQNDLALHIAKVWADLCELFRARCNEFKSEIRIEVIEGSSEMCFVDALQRILNPQDIVDISLTDCCN